MLPARIFEKVVGQMDERKNAYLEKVAGMIEEHGWIVQAIGTSPMLFYTVGLAEKGLPEVVITGVPMEAAKSIMNTFARKLVEDKFTLDDAAMERGDKFEGVLEGFKAQLRWVPPMQTKQLNVARVFAPSDDFKAVQIIWPDPKGRFAGEAGFEEKFKLMQDLTFVLADEGTLQ